MLDTFGSDCGGPIDTGISWHRFRMPRSSVTHSFVAITSASHELRAVCACRIDFHEMGPPLRQTIKFE